MGDIQDTSVTRSSFDGFVVKRLLQDIPNTKTVFVLGSLHGQPAIATLERRHFNQDEIIHLLSGSSQLACTLSNDIYSSYALTSTARTPIDARLIFPATEKHIAKYAPQIGHMVQETPEIYREKVLPYIASLPESRISWVYNILDGTKEADTVILRDEDANTGFVFLPDMKWNRHDILQLYCIAIVIPRDIRSIRDLTRAHLPLLKNVREKGLQCLKEKYGIVPDAIRTYLHYQPSYYHLHIHFSHLSFEAPGTYAGKAHLLDDVIANIEQDDTYYQTHTFTCILGSESPVYKAITSGIAQEKA